MIYVICGDALLFVPLNFSVFPLKKVSLLVLSFLICYIFSASEVVVTIIIPFIYLVYLLN